MKKTLFIFSLFLLFIGNIYAQPATFERIGCTDQATVTLNGFQAAGIANPLYIGSNVFLPCGEDPLDVVEFISYQTQGVHYVLQVLQGTTWVDLKTFLAYDSPYTITYDNFTQGSSYRVEAKVLTVQAIRGTTYSNPDCNDGIPIHDGNSLSYFTQVLEFIDDPLPSTTLLDLSGFPFNGCFGYGDPVFIDGSSSFGETSFYINMSMHDGQDGPQLAWTSCGFYTGQVGIYDVLNDLWRYNFPNWDLWAGYHYRIHIVYQNSCNGWVNFFDWFQVQDLPCRTLDTKPQAISVFPNPTSDEIRLKGIDNINGGLPYQIVSLSSGKMIRQDQLPTPAMPINVRELENGLYIIRMEMDGRVVSEKFSVLR